MSETEIVILPEDIYKLFIISDPPENFADFDAFGCAECQEPVGIKKPEGVPDLPPYVPKKQRLSNDNAQQQPNHNRQQQHKYNFQRGGKFKQQYHQQQQQQQQQQQKKIVSTVEVSPEFANKDLGTWAKKSPALSPTSSSPATNVKFASANFNPEKAPSASPYSSASFNPQLVSSSKSSSTSSSALFQPQTTQSQAVSQQQSHQLQPAQQSEQQQQPVQQHPKPSPPKVEEKPQKQSSAWGNIQSKPKPQSFAELLKNEQSAKPSTDNRAAPAFKPETISRPQAEQVVGSIDDKDFPSFSSISKPKANQNSPWSNIK